MLSIVKADIASLTADALVNAANTSLLGGGGVDGAIHRAAGPRLLEECRTLGGCPTGEAKTTKGYDLRAYYVIHTVGPVWRGGKEGEDRLLASCYDACFREADRLGVRSIAFPSISTGAFGFPVDKASRIALRGILRSLESTPDREITVAVFDDHSMTVYESARKEIGL